MKSQFFKYILTIVALFAITTPASAEEVKLHGSTTVAYNVISNHKAEIETLSGHSLAIVPNGSGKGVLDTLSQQADIGMISASLEEVVSSLKLANKSVSVDKLDVHEVGESKIVFVTHRSNPVNALTRKQLSGILSGKIKKWTEVGGPDFPIFVITETPVGGLRAKAEAVLNEGRLIAAKKKELPNARQIAKVVSQVPAALGIISPAFIDDSLGVIQLDEPIIQKLYFVTQGELSPAVKAVIEASRMASGLVAKPVVEEKPAVPVTQLPVDAVAPETVAKEQAQSSAEVKTPSEE